MANNGIIDPINENSYVMESGANSGGILNELNKKYGCKCLGIDISKKAIITGQGFFSENKKVNLEIVDVLNYDYFSKYEDKEFTHIFTSSHLIHVPNGERKSKPNPKSKTNLSPLPSSTSQDAFACDLLKKGRPVPKATILISSGISVSEFGKYCSA